MLSLLQEQAAVGSGEAGWGVVSANGRTRTHCMARYLETRANTYSEYAVVFRLL